LGPKVVRSRPMQPRSRCMGMLQPPYRLRSLVLLLSKLKARADSERENNKKELPEFPRPRFCEARRESDFSVVGSPASTQHPLFWKPGGKCFYKPGGPEVSLFVNICDMTWPRPPVVIPNCAFGFLRWSYHIGSWFFPVVIPNWALVFSGGHWGGVSCSVFIERAIWSCAYANTILFH